MRMPTNTVPYIYVDLIKGKISGNLSQTMAELSDTMKSFVDTVNSYIDAFNKREEQEKAMSNPELIHLCEHYGFKVVF
jgi:hypothetical protein